MTQFWKVNYAVCEINHKEERISCWIREKAIIFNTLSSNLTITDRVNPNSMQGKPVVLIVIEIVVDLVT